MKKISFLATLFITQLVVAQTEKYPFTKWDEKTNLEAATAANTTYLSNKEKEIVYLINLVRNNPKLFWDTYAKKYIDEKGLEKNASVKTLKKELIEAKTVKYLVPDADLQKISEELATSQEQSGKVGHGKLEVRIKKLPVKFKNSFVSENLYYGSFDALDVVMSWLIDDGIKDEGHRKSILEPRNRFVGISIKPHSKQKNVVVMNFANQTYWE